MLGRIAVLVIELYLKYLSPHKGFCCASRVLSGGPSCSEYTRKAIAEQGLLSALPDIRE